MDTGNTSRDAQRTAWLRTELAQEARSLSVRIMGVAFTETADFELIQALAQSTGGERFGVLEARETAGTFVRIADILGAPAPRPAPKAPEVATPTQPLLLHEKPATPYGAAKIAVPAVCTLLLLGGAALLLRRWLARLPLEATITDMSDPAMVYHLKKKLSYVGRDPGCDVVISRATVGSRHAAIRFEGNTFWLRDLRSTNGTWLNGVRLALESSPSEEPLRSGDVVRLHKYSFLFAVESGTQTEVAERVTQVVSVFCVNHPSKAALEYCDQCGKMYCNQCVRAAGDRFLCTTCQAGQAQGHPA